jgi:hypothetical protein
VNMSARGALEGVLEDNFRDLVVAGVAEAEASVDGWDRTRELDAEADTEDADAPEDESVPELDVKLSE